MKRVICFIGSKILARKGAYDFLLPLDEVKQRLPAASSVGHQHKGIYVIRSDVEIADDILSEAGFQAVELKRFLAGLEESEQSLLLRHFHWLNWSEQSRFCGQCGQRLRSSEDKVEKYCETCCVEVFPRFSPAVMVLVCKGDEVILARSPHFVPGMYSAIAGFIDVGESAEQAAHREVHEELGVEITDLQYFGTQTWPFPDSFMVAFTARYLSGDLTIDHQELEDAQWFHRDNLPDYPASASISKRLIDSFRENNG